ncbi:hypothetical protein [Arthrobacter sp. NyZ413]|uniref:hypothetical protein n=1 Tax=Arthrobacter sp. NyZ413 TaxID=3144669 RepID=UPI003BF8DC13
MIQDSTITAILENNYIPAPLHTDPELRSIAYSLARLNDPVSGPEARFYEACSEMPGDEDGEDSYLLNNTAALREIYHQQLSDRRDELEP